MDRGSFDRSTAHWDDEGKRERARRAAECIARRVPLTPQTRVFEYGCGTGLLSFALHSDVGPMVLADSSQGMLDTADSRIAQTGATNMRTLKLDLTAEPPPAGSFELVCALMSLHHVVPLEPVLRHFATMLAPDGRLCVADLVAEGGAFHGEGFEGHHGFTREQFECLLEPLGLHVEHWDSCMEVTRGRADGTTRTFPVFLMTAGRAAGN